jgi:hypothetical protein
VPSARDTSNRRMTHRDARRSPVCPAGAGSGLLDALDKGGEFGESIGRQQIEFAMRFSCTAASGHTRAGNVSPSAMRLSEGAFQPTERSAIGTALRCRFARAGTLAIARRKGLGFRDGLDGLGSLTSSVAPPDLVWFGHSEEADLYGVDYGQPSRGHVRVGCRGSRDGIDQRQNPHEMLLPGGWTPAGEPSELA